MPSVEVNGIQMYYELKGEGPTIVLSHGGAGNHAVWFKQTSYFSRWFQVLTYDARMYGLSRDIPDGPGADSAIDDFEGLLTALDVKKPILVGQSRGGGDVVGYAMRHPDNVGALVLTGSLAGFIPTDAARVWNAANRERQQKMTQLERLMTKEFREREPEQTELFMAINSFNSINYLKAPFPAELITYADYAAFEIPTFFICGAEDVLMTMEILTEAHSLLPTSSLAVIPGAAHSSYWEKPDAWNFGVHNFIRQIGLEGPSAV